MTKARNIADLGSNDVIETTATGVDVTGTVTADGLVVENNTTDVKGLIKNTLTGGSRTATLDIVPQNDGAYGLSIQTSGGSGTGTFKFNNKNTMKFDLNNDVSFYEDTGTTAKMVWDSSAESLGIGTSSPSTNLHVYDATTNVVGTFESGDADVYITLADGSTTSDTAMRIGVTSNDMHFSTSATERMRIDSAGNVGIGTASPASKLELSGIGTGVWLTLDRQDTNTNIIDFTETGTRLGYVGYVGDNLIINNAKTSSTTFNIANAEKMRLDSSGNLLVGSTASPTTNASSGNVVGSIFSSSSHTVANVSSSYVNSGFSIGNTRASYLVTVSGGAANNGSTLATYIFTKAAYDAELVQLGNTASHFNNVTIEAGLSSVSASTVELRVRFGGSNLTGTGTITTNAIRIG